MNTAVKPRVIAPRAGESLTELCRRVSKALPDIASKVTLLEEIYAAPSYERQIEIMGQYVEFVEEGE